MSRARSGQVPTHPAQEMHLLRSKIRVRSVRRLADIVAECTNLPASMKRLGNAFCPLTNLNYVVKTQYSMIEYKRA